MRTPDVYPRFSWQATRKVAAEQCEVCGKPSTQYVGAEPGYSASGHNVCDAHADRYKTSSRKTAGSSMTRQHFDAIAGTVASSSLSASDKRALAGELAEALMGFNDQFNPARFIDACTK